MNEPMDPFDQSAFSVRLAWGARGARRAAARGDLLVVVDTLSFSSAVVTAAAHGVAVRPCSWDEDAATVAAATGATAAVARDRVPADGRYSLSPLTFVDAPTGARVVVRSPNGATCSRHAEAVPHLLVAALLNAGAAAATARRLDAGGITVLACGERWEDDGTLRVAVEDYLGAGAVLAHLGPALSPEAEICAAAFAHARPDLERLLLACGSGRELSERGFAGDVRHAARLDRYDVVPVMREGWLLGA